MEKFQNHETNLQDKYDMAARAAPRCMAVQHIAAFCSAVSSREPDATNTCWDYSKRNSVIRNWKGKGITLQNHMHNINLFYSNLGTASNKHWCEVGVSFDKIRLLITYVWWCEFHYWCCICKAFKCTDEKRPKFFSVTKLFYDDGSCRIWCVQKEKKIVFSTIALKLVRLCI